MSYIPKRNLKKRVNTIMVKSIPIAIFLAFVGFSNFSNIEIKVTKTGTIDYHMANR